MLDLQRHAPDGARRPRGHVHALPAALQELRRTSDRTVLRDHAVPLRLPRRIAMTKWHLIYALCIWIHGAAFGRWLGRRSPQRFHRMG